MAKQEVKTAQAQGAKTDQQERLGTTHPVRRIPYVPSAVRNRPFTIHPIKK